VEKFWVEISTSKLSFSGFKFLESFLEEEAHQELNSYFMPPAPSSFYLFIYFFFSSFVCLFVFLIFFSSSL
jgi:hypothetical protein